MAAAEPRDAHATNAASNGVEILFIDLSTLSLLMGQAVSAGSSDRSDNGSDDAMTWTRHVILRTMRTASLLATLAVTACLFACGQKGPLLLPEAQHPRKKLVVPKPVAPTAIDNPGDGKAPPAPQP